VGFYRTTLKLVPTEEMVDVLTVKKKEGPKVDPGSWVRIKRGVYAGDLAEVFFLQTFPSYSSSPSSILCHVLFFCFISLF